MNVAIVTCENLTKRYGTITALKKVTLSVEPGIVGLLGPNGAGKSTLISVLLGQTSLTSGRATVLQLDCRRQQRLIRRRVGFVPENDCIIPGLSGTGYVYYTGRLAGMSHGDSMQRTHEVLDYVALEEARYRPTEGYSTGMKQRLKLAQALVHDPDLIFLDEPTNGMDPQGRQIMLSLITDLGRAGISVLLSSHLLPDVQRVCQRVIIMGGGEILKEGQLDDLNKPHPTKCRMEFTGDSAAMRNALQQREVTVHTACDGKFDIELPAENTQMIVVEAAKNIGARLTGLTHKRSSLEETFMEAIQRQTTP